MTIKIARRGFVWEGEMWGVETDFSEALEGLRQLESKLRDQYAWEAIDKALDPLLAEAKRLAPDDPATNGRDLKKSLRKLMSKIRRRGGKARGKVGSTLEYAYPVEAGHKIVKGGRQGSGGKVVGTVPPKPYLRPALANKSDEILQIFGRSIEESLKNEFGGNDGSN